MSVLQTIHVSSTNLHWNKEYYEQVVFENRYIPLENRNVKYQMSILKKLNCYKAVKEFILSDRQTDRYTHTDI